MTTDTEHFLLLEKIAVPQTNPLVSYIINFNLP